MASSEKASTWTLSRLRGCGGADEMVDGNKKRIGRTNSGALSRFTGGIRLNPEGAEAATNLDSTEKSY
jgi:hypothetical protein